MLNHFPQLIFTALLPSEHKIVHLLKSPSSLTVYSAFVLVFTVSASEVQVLYSVFSAQSPPQLFPDSLYFSMYSVLCPHPFQAFQDQLMPLKYSWMCALPLGCKALSVTVCRVTQAGL